MNFLAGLRQAPPSRSSRRGALQSKAKINFKTENGYARRSQLQRGIAQHRSIFNLGLAGRALAGPSRALHTTA